MSSAAHVEAAKAHLKQEAADWRASGVTGTRIARQRAPYALRILEMSDAEWERVRSDLRRLLNL